MIFGLGRHGRPSRLAVETLLSTVNTAIVALVFVSAGPVLFILTREDPIVCVAGAAFVSSFTARLYTRTFAYARRRPPVAIAGDFLTISAAALVLLASWWGWGRLDLPFVFAGLASGNILAMAVELRLLHLKPRLKRPAISTPTGRSATPGGSIAPSIPRPSARSSRAPQPIRWRSACSRSPARRSS